jgi:hypothetical protein
VSGAGANVLELCRSIAQAGGGDFNVVGTGPATFQFRWYDGQLGTDRTASVVFALEWGNMAEPELSYPRQDEVNAVKVVGQGEDADRETLWVSTAGLIDDSPWNRLEALRSSRSTPAAGLQAVGDAALEELRPKRTLRFQVLQTPACVYGQHYFLGDLVRTKFLDYEGTQKVRTVWLTATKAYGSSVTVETTDV